MSVVVVGGLGVGGTGVGEGVGCGVGGEHEITILPVAIVPDWTVPTRRMMVSPLKTLKVACSWFVAPQMPKSSQSALSGSAVTVGVELEGQAPR